METIKRVFGVLAALGPVVYCGGLAFYFFQTSGSAEEVQTMGLGPTVLGLTLVGVILCIPLFFRLARLFARSRMPGSRGGGGPDCGLLDDDREGSKAADEVIARYLANRSSAPSPAATFEPSARLGPASPARTGFGRR